MVKTTVTPDHDHIELSIPESYIGKRVEVLMYTIDDLEDAQPSSPDVTKKASQFKGILSAEMAVQYQQHISESRNEWQTRI